MLSGRSLASLLLLATFLAGCGGTPSTVESPPSTQPVAVSTPAPDGQEASNAPSSQPAAVPSPGPADESPSTGEADVLPPGESEAPSGQGRSEPAASAFEGCLAQAPKPPSNVTKALVVRAVDGDTLQFSDGERVRLIGINTPESVDPRRPVEAYGKEAAAYTQQLTAGQEVYYVPGQTPQDRYGRLLAWVWLPNGEFLNAKLVYDGYAQVYTFADNPDHADLLLECQREAREANRGLWALPEYQDGHLAAETTEDAAAQEAATAAEPEPAPAEEAQPATPEIIEAPGTVSRGSTVSVTVKTKPGDRCSITVIYKSGASTAQGLVPKQANDAGTVSWSWKVGTRTTPGTWPVIISCGSGTVRTSVTVP